VADREMTVAVIDETAGAIKVRELTEFLWLFRTVYVAGLSLIGGIPGVYLDPHQARIFVRPAPSIVGHADVQAFATHTRSVLAFASKEEVAWFAELVLPDWAEDLSILTISRNSPLRITFTGIAIALAAAVIISGGSYKIGPVSAELPPLGTGIAALRKALNLEEEKTTDSRGTAPDPKKRK
jgi:hypothetical protein